MTAPHTASTSDARKRLAERNAATQADTSVEAVARAVLHQHAMARPAGEVITWCVCLRWSVNRDALGADEFLYEAHVAAALADALNGAGVTGGGAGV